MQTKRYSPDSDVIHYVITITRPLYFLLVPISFRCPKSYPGFVLSGKRLVGERLWGKRPVTAHTNLEL